MSMYEESTTDPGESWSPPEDESAGLNTSAPNAPPQPDYMNPPEGNPIQRGAQATERFMGNTFGRQGPMPVTGSYDEPDVGGAIAGGAKRIASYLMGEGATSPQEAEKIIDQLKKQGMTDDDANLLAIHEAAAAGGPAAAWGMVQYNRMAFNAKQSFARVALNGVDGKAGDVAAAADAATKAGSHVLDGSSAAFHADRYGVTATVTLPGTSQRQTFEMTKDQFNAYLDLSKTSQWDRLMEEGGVPVALTKVGAKPIRGQASESDNAGTSTTDTKAPAGIPEDDGAQPGYHPGTAPDSDAVKTGSATARDVTTADQPAIPGTHDAHGHYLGPKDRDRTNYGAELEARSEKVFGKGNVNAEGSRQQWMASQEEKELERDSKLAQANAKGAFDVKKAGIAAGARVKSSENSAGARVGAAQVTADGRSASADKRLAYLRDDLNRKTQAMAQSHQDQGMRERGRMARAELAAKPGASEADIAKIYEKLGIKLPQGDTPTSVAPQQQAPQRPANIPEGAKQYKGQWYVRGPNGESVPVQ